MMTGLRTLAAGFALMASFGVAVLVVALGAPALESKFAPVSQYTGVEVVGHEAEFMLVEVVGVKTRNCRLLEITALVETGGQWKRADILIDEQPMRPRSRPTGFQSFGVWKFKPPGSAVRLVAWHECHGLWSTFTNLGTWALPKTK